MLQHTPFCSQSRSRLQSVGRRTCFSVSLLPLGALLEHPLACLYAFSLWLVLLYPCMHACMCECRYASCQVHPGPVLDLQLLSDCSITVSSAKAAVTTPGGFTRAAVALDPAVRAEGCVGLAE